MNKITISLSDLLILSQTAVESGKLADRSDTPLFTFERMCRFDCGTRVMNAVGTIPITFEIDTTSTEGEPPVMDNKKE